MDLTPRIVETKKMKLNSRMHDWAAVNNWPRPATNSSYGTRYGRYSVNIPITTIVPQKLKVRRCHTTLNNEPSVTSLTKNQVFKPRHNGLHRESSTLDYIRYLEVSNKESEAKLKNTMHVLSVQRSRSDVDVRDTPTSMAGFTMGGAGLMKERGQIYGQSPADFSRHEGASIGNKQEMKVGVAVVPRKGLISLSTNGEAEQQLPDIAAHGESRKLSISGYEHGSGKVKNKSLIKRKDIMDHFMAGFKRLEDEEQQKQQEEELQKSLGEYTIMDLQSKILQMTDAKSVKRSGHVDSQSGTTNIQHLKPEKTVLPAIKNINPFAVK
ncbi:hypothetical protein ACF0H5_021158 [Mactra antiquata]